MKYIIKYTAGDCKGKYAACDGEPTDRRRAFECATRNEAYDLLDIAYQLGFCADEDKAKIIKVK